MNDSLWSSNFDDDDTPTASPDQQTEAAAPPPPPTPAARAAPPPVPRLEHRVAPPPAPPAPDYYSPPLRRNQPTPVIPSLAPSHLPPDGNGKPRPNLPLIAVLGVLAVAVLALAVVLVTRSGNSSKPAAAPASNNSRASAAASPQLGNTQVGNSSTPSTSTPLSHTEPRTPRAAARLQTYNGPGRLTVQAPVGWSRDKTANLASVNDFDAPGTSVALSGSTFRIGVGNKNPAASILAEGAQAAGFLRSQYHARIISGVSSGSFLNSDYAQFEYQYLNTTYNVARRGIERIWHKNGITYIIQSSGRVGDFALTQAVFRDLILHASVH